MARRLCPSPSGSTPFFQPLTYQIARFKAGYSPSLQVSLEELKHEFRALAYHLSAQQMTALAHLHHPQSLAISPMNPYATSDHRSRSPVPLHELRSASFHNSSSMIPLSQVHRPGLKGAVIGWSPDNLTCLRHDGRLRPRTEVALNEKLQMPSIQDRLHFGKLESASLSLPGHLTGGKILMNTKQLHDVGSGQHGVRIVQASDAVEMSGALRRNSGGGRGQIIELGSSQCSGPARSPDDDVSLNKMVDFKVKRSAIDADVGLQTVSQRQVPGSETKAERKGSLCEEQLETNRPIGSSGGIMKRAVVSRRVEQKHQFERQRVIGSKSGLGFHEAYEVVAKGSHDESRFTQPMRQHTTCERDSEKNGSFAGPRKLRGVQEQAGSLGPVSTSRTGNKRVTSKATVKAATEW
jgi:hypothetical protein